MNAPVRLERGDFSAFADGSVKVAGSVLYDQKAEAEARGKIRKISERPAYTYN
jgi:hypothetical protein